MVQGGSERELFMTVSSQCKQRSEMDKVRAIIHRVPVDSMSTQFSYFSVHKKFVPYHVFSCNVSSTFFDPKRFFPSYARTFISNVIFGVCCEACSSSNCYDFLSLSFLESQHERNFHKFRNDFLRVSINSQ